jgi:hypothetical protein
VTPVGDVAAANPALDVIVKKPFDRGGKIRLARHALDGRPRPVDVALRLAARGAGT